MTEEQMVPVAYVGQKQFKTDNVAGSGVVWIGAGDVQPVPARLWPLLSKHPGVWALAEAEIAQSPEVVSNDLGEKTAESFILVGQDDVQLDLATLDDAALKAFVKKHDLGNAGNRRGDKLRRFIVDAVKAS